jgi:hypothetical protein
MSKRTAVLTGAFLVTTALSAAAQDERDAPREVDIDGAEPPAEESCFYVREVRNFDALDDRYIYVEGTGGDHFLLTMFGVCPGLEGAFGIAISNQLDRVCSIDNAKVTYRGLGRLETCNIRKVEAVEDKAAAEALTAARLKADGGD